MLFNTRFIIIIFITLILHSCSNPQIERINKHIATNKSEILLITEKSKTEEAHIFAPKIFSQACVLHKKYKNNPNISLDKVINTYVSSINKSKSIKIQIPKLIKTRINAIKAGAKIGIDEFEIAEKELIEITSNIEENNELDKEDVLNLTKKYKLIELNIIKENFLAETKKIINKCIEIGGVELAPKSLKEAQTYYTDVEKYIDQNRYGTKQITIKSEEALFMAERALNITLNVKQSSHNSLENTIIRYERMLLDISQTLEIKDLRNKSFNEQITDITSYISSLFKAGRKINLEKNKINSKINQIKQVVSQLTKQERIRKLMDGIQSDFNLAEAEVYQQDERIIIRLTGLNFTSGHYSLSDNNELLLIKVGINIKKLGKSVVIIEGHTDSVGIDKQNKKLSENRAISVKDFLLDKKFIKDELSSISGYGDTRPIASNKTIIGQAQNRRVDIIITPLDF